FRRVLFRSDPGILRICQVAALVVSADNGATWQIRKFPGSTNSNSDPWVDVGPNNTVYVGYRDSNGKAYMTVSRDHGLTWATPVDVGAPQGVLTTEFPSVVVGDDNRAAVAFLGTSTPGDDQGAVFQGVWYLYVAFTYDGGVTWTTYNATPRDPVQRGCIWLGGGINSCRNLLDVIGI